MNFKRIICWIIGHDLQLWVNNHKRPKVMLLSVECDRCHEDIPYVFRQRFADEF